MVPIMVNKSINLTIFFVILTLTIGHASINPLQSSTNEAFALDKKINDVEKKARSPHDVESNGIKDKISNFIDSCLSNGTTLPLFLNDDIDLINEK